VKFFNINPRYFFSKAPAHSNKTERLNYKIFNRITSLGIFFLTVNNMENPLIPLLNHRETYAFLLFVLLGFQNKALKKEKKTLDITVLRKREAKRRLNKKYKTLAEKNFWKINDDELKMLQTLIVKYDTKNIDCRSKIKKLFKNFYYYDKISKDFFYSKEFQESLAFVEKQYKSYLENMFGISIKPFKEYFQDDKELSEILKIFTKIKTKNQNKPYKVRKHPQDTLTREFDTNPDLWENESIYDESEDDSPSLSNTNYSPNNPNNSHNGDGEDLFNNDN
jgi:hypothetical protein